MVYNAPTHAMQILKPAMKKITTIYPANPQYKKMILKHPESKLLSYASPTQIAKFFPVHPDSFSSSDPNSSSGSAERFLICPRAGRGYELRYECFTYCYIQQFCNHCPTNHLNIQLSMRHLIHTVRHLYNTHI